MYVEASVWNLHSEELQILGFSALLKTAQGTAKGGGTRDLSNLRNGVFSAKKREQERERESI